jgi:hypothetical protein
LAVEDVAELAERPGDVAARDDGKLAQTAISTVSSEIAGGIGSPWALRLSR